MDVPSSTAETIPRNAPGWRASSFTPRSLLGFGLKVLLLAAIVFFIWHATTLLYEARYSVTRQDFWRIYKLDLVRSFPGNVFCKHNDHPVLFPSLIWLPILHWFHNDQTLLFFCGYALTLATLALLWVSLWVSPLLPVTVRIALGLLYTVATLWVGKANILASGGFSCMNSLATVAVVAGLLAFSALEESSSGKTRFVLVLSMLTAGIVATFSFASGMAVWPALLALALFRRSGWRMLLALGVTGICCVGLFLLMPNDSKSEVGDSLSGLFANPPMLVVHFAQTLGAPWGFAAEWLLSPGHGVSPLILGGVIGGLGMVGAAIVTYERWRSRSPEEVAELVAHGVLLFILGSVALITIGRHGAMMAHPNEALAPRYYFWTTFFWAALPVTILYRWPWLRARSASFALLALALSAFSLPSSRSMGSAYVKGRAASENAALRLVCGAEEEESLQYLFRKRAAAAGIVQRLASIYRRLGLDMFAWPGAQRVGELLPAAEPSAAPSEIRGRWKIDKQLGPSVRGEATAQFSGWALTSKGRQPADYVLVYQGNGRIVGLGRMTVRRPDLNERFELGTEVVVGFQGYIRNYSDQQHYDCRAAFDGALVGQELKRSDR